MVFVGSKFRFAKFLVPIIQSYIDKYQFTTYVEPFVGGANIIDKISCERRIGCDVNKELIGIYKAAQKGWIPPADCTEDMYLQAREGLIEEPLRSYIGFNAAFGSKYFGGFARGRKPDGSPRIYYEERTRNFIKQIPLLKDIEFYHLDYRQPWEDVLIYCDPPYKNTIGYGNKFDHDEFWQWAREQSKDNIVLISEYEAPDDFECIWQGNKRASSLDRNTGGKSAEEKLWIKR